MLSRPQSRDVYSQERPVSRKEAKQKVPTKPPVRLNKVGGVEVTPVEAQLAFGEL